MSRVIPVLVLAFVFSVAGCATKEIPTIVTKEVKIAVPVPCTIDLKEKRPALLTLPELQEQLAVAPNVDSKAKLITTQLLFYIGWLPVIEGAIQGCKMAPNAATK
jgi:hypothetical protein